MGELTGDNRSRRVKPLSARERLLGGAAGGISLAAGGAAVLLGHDGAGALGLVGVGGLLLIYALQGVPMVNLKVGGNEVTWPEQHAIEAVARAQTEAIEGNPEGAKRIVEELVRPKSPSFVLSDEGRRAFQWYSEVILVLDLLAARHRSTLGTPPPPDGPIDHFIETPGHGKIAVAIWANPAKESAKRLASALSQTDEYAGVLVISHGMTGLQRIREALEIPAAVALWKGSDYTGKLMLAFEFLMAQIEEARA